MTPSPDKIAHRRQEPDDHAELSAALRAAQRADLSGRRRDRGGLRARAARRGRCADGGRGGIFMLDTNYWIPSGRGKDFQFFATDEEIVELLEYRLPVSFAPYELISLKYEKEFDRYVFHPKRVSIESYSQLHSEAVGFFFLRSLILTELIKLYNSNEIQEKL